MKHDSLGVYLSIPFCKAKCSFCNFASGVFPAEQMDPYVSRICAELRHGRSLASALGAELPERVDTVYFGGGTPSLLDPTHLSRIFRTLREVFTLDDDAEITLEAAPGQIDHAILAEAVDLGINRVSLGVQSFVDIESGAVGRSHTRDGCRAEIDRLRASGIPSISLDLIAGLPYQTAASWSRSLGETIASEVDHVSVYLLEVDEDSRLGREALAGGGGYHAGALPEEDLAADLYQEACERLAWAGLEQYEISNFARPGFASRQNLKYWQRSPYLGAGLDAHSMLRKNEVLDPLRCGAVRWANTSEMNEYLAGSSPSPFPLLVSAGVSPVDHVDAARAFEEALFLGLRLSRGVDLDDLRVEFGKARLDAASEVLEEVQAAGLLRRSAENIHLTPAGRLASNEVFSRLLAT